MFVLRTPWVKVKPRNNFEVNVLQIYLIELDRKSHESIQTQHNSVCILLIWLRSEITLVIMLVLQNVKGKHENIDIIH